MSPEITAAKIGAFATIAAAIIGAGAVLMSQDPKPDGVTRDLPPAAADQTDQISISPDRGTEEKHSPAAEHPLAAVESAPQITGQGLQEIASITSAPTPQSGQDHRSSPDFGLFGGGKHYVWRVTQNGVENSVIRFNVKDNKKFKDPVVFANIGNGSRTSTISERSLYIADPDGAAGQSFLVTVLADPN